MGVGEPIAHNSLQKEAKENKGGSFLERIKRIALSQGSPLHWGDHLACHPSKRGKGGLKPLASVPQEGRSPRKLTVSCGRRRRRKDPPAFTEYRSRFLSDEALFPFCSPPLCALAGNPCHHAIAFPPSGVTAISPRL